jgi:hypothetical protein
MVFGGEDEGNFTEMQARFLTLSLSHCFSLMGFVAVCRGGKGNCYRVASAFLYFECVSLFLVPLYSLSIFAH